MERGGRESVHVAVRVRSPGLLAVSTGLALWRLERASWLLWAGQSPGKGQSGVDSGAKRRDFGTLQWASRRKTRGQGGALESAGKW